MGLFQTNKPKSAGKVMIPSGDHLTSKVLGTLDAMSRMAGETLGPGGKQVLIERSEMGMKPIITKDGVTVIKNLGFKSAINQLILESARDAALRTASEAGDGTTTATILSASIAKRASEALAKNPKVSPQRMVREMQALVPYLKSLINNYKIDTDGVNYTEILTKVATLSANGDTELATVIIEALNTVGEEGNLTLVETMGPSHYEVERINGYTIDTGYEESCKKFAQGFINDRSGTMVTLQKPLFILYDGVVNDLNQVLTALNKISDHFDRTKNPDRNVVLVAHGFSDPVIGELHVNWNHPQTINVFPLLTPQNAILNSRSQFLFDLQAYTGAPVFNPMDRPVSDMDPERMTTNSLVKMFESGRFRSSVVSDEDTEAISIRVDELKERLKNPESDYELNDINVRIGKLTSGIARLNIYGPSQGETREKRDRAEDAWMAVRGAIKYGAVPGGGYVLTRLAADLLAVVDRVGNTTKKMAAWVLGEALLSPVYTLYRNYGYTEEEIVIQVDKILANEDEVFDLANENWVPKNDLLDSLPAVSEAIENSISIASLLGTLGGIVSFDRDNETDKEEERFMRNFERTINGPGDGE